MANPDFERLQTKDPDLNRVQDNVQRSANRTPKNGRGRQQKFSFTAGQSYNIPHKLGRKILGAQAVTNTGGAQFTITPSTIDPKRFITIVASVDTDAEFWMY